MKSVSPLEHADQIEKHSDQLPRQYSVVLSADERSKRMFDLESKEYPTGRGGNTN
jgi:hypothetical protein